MPFKQSGRIDGRKLESGFLGAKPQNADGKFASSGGAGIKQSSPPGKTILQNMSTQDHTDSGEGRRDMKAIPKSKMMKD